MCDYTRSKVHKHVMNMNEKEQRNNATQELTPTANRRGYITDACH